MVAEEDEKEEEEQDRGGSAAVGVIALCDGGGARLQIRHVRGAGWESVGSVSGLVKRLSPSTPLSPPRPMKGDGQRPSDPAAVIT